MNYARKSYVREPKVLLINFFCEKTILGGIESGTATEKGIENWPGHAV